MHLIISYVIAILWCALLTNFGLICTYHENICALLTNAFDITLQFMIVRFLYALWKSSVMIIFTSFLLPRPSTLTCENAEDRSGASCYLKLEV